MSILKQWRRIIPGLCKIPTTADSACWWNDHCSRETRTRSTTRSAYCKKPGSSIASSSPCFYPRWSNVLHLHLPHRHRSWFVRWVSITFSLNADVWLSRFLSLETTTYPTSWRWTVVARFTEIFSIWFHSLPTILGTTVIDKLVPHGPKPPPQVIIEQYPQLPQKPQDVIIERWLPVPPRQRRILYERLPPNTRPGGGRPIIVQYGPPHVRIQREVITQPGSSLPYPQVTGRTDVNQVLSQLGGHQSLQSSSVIIFQIIIFSSMMFAMFSVASVFLTWLQSAYVNAARLFSGQPISS